MSEDKDRLITMLFEELKKTREKMDELNDKVAELSSKPKEEVNEHQKIVSLAELRDIVNKQHELSDDRKECVDKAVDMLLKYAKAINYI